MSTEAVNNEDLELEEGEIAEDSADDADVTPDLDYTDQGGAAATLPDATGVGAGISCEVGPQKKRKKVVRKVRRKIKVKKKVVRKKGNSGNNESGVASTVGGSNANVDNNMSSSISGTLSSNPNSNNQSMLPSNAPLLPHLAQQSLDPNLMLNNQQQHHHVQQLQHHPPYQQHLNNQNNHQHHHNLLPQTQQHQQQPQQHLHQLQTNSTQIDSLWEQQILVLQELQRQQQVDQQLTQILRAAATDEDFRVFPSPLTSLANSNQQQTMATQLITPMMANTNIAAVTTTPITNATNPTNATTTTITTTTHSPSKPMILHSQTPSSPDDENGKSSYEAITKMLTLLRNSANVSDSSENLEIDINHHFNNPHRTNEDPMQDSKQGTKDTIEYSLIPILIEGIDYTKYKLLSQYEPKFKNDPRLNQQT